MEQEDGDVVAFEPERSGLLSAAKDIMIVIDFSHDDTGFTIVVPGL